MKQVLINQLEGGYVVQQVNDGRPEDGVVRVSLEAVFKTVENILDPQVGELIEIN